MELVNKVAEYDNKHGARGTLCQNLCAGLYDWSSFNPESVDKIRGKIWLAFRVTSLLTNNPELDKLFETFQSRGATYRLLECPISDVVPCDLRTWQVLQNPEEFCDISRTPLLESSRTRIDSLAMRHINKLSIKGGRVGHGE